MALTSPDNIWTPDGSDNYSLVTDLAATASSVQNALTKRANSYTGTTTERTAFTDAAPTGTIWSDSNGSNDVWVKRGSGWVRILDTRDVVPTIIDAGDVTITPSGTNTQTSATVTFNETFTARPFVVATPRSTVPFSRSVSVCVANITTTGCTIWLGRTSIAATTVNWIAVQP